MTKTAKSKSISSEINLLYYGAVFSTRFFFLALFSTRFIPNIFDHPLTIRKKQCWLLTGRRDHLIRPGGGIGLGFLGPILERKEARSASRPYPLSFRFAAKPSIQMQNPNKKP